MKALVQSALAIALTLGINTPPAAAQPRPAPTLSFGALAGWGQTSDDEGSLGNGVVVGATLDRRLWGRFGGEVTLQWQEHHRDVGYFKADGRTLWVTAALKRTFKEGRTRPYFFAGLAAAHHVGTLAWPGFAPPETVFRYRDQSLDPGLTFGTGLRIHRGGRLEWGPEFRVLGTWPEDDTNPAIAAWLGLRVSLR